MLPNIISQPPLIIPHNAFQRTLYIIFVLTAPTNRRPRTSRARNRRITHTLIRTLGALLLLEPARAFRLPTRLLRVGDGAGVDLDERGICARCASGSAELRGCGSG